MNLAAYIDGLTRSAKNLPGVLHGWADFDADLQSHYADALTEQLVMAGTARSSALMSDDRFRLQQTWAQLLAVVVRHAAEIEALMGLNVFELLTPSTVSGAAVGVEAVDANDSFAMAA
jgi:hypothetical protein